MKSKKTVYIIFSVLAVCLVGVILSKVINWPVDNENAEGNIAKTSRFSRKTAEGCASNMQELLLSDEDYKGGILATYVIMKARADQFGALVNLSSEAAGGIQEFQPVLQDMKKALPTVNNVCASLQTACEDLDSVLGGGTPKNLEQDANNAALAYSTLQKLNKLADSFIETTDKYLQNADADDRLKLVRDQWVSYQQVTAVRADDARLAQDLEERGMLLDAEQSRNALNAFDSGSLEHHSNIIPGAAVARMTELTNGLADVFLEKGNLNSSELLGHRKIDPNTVRPEEQLQNALQEGLQNSQLIVAGLENSMREVVLARPKTVNNSELNEGELRNNLQDAALKNESAFQDASMIMSTTMDQFDNLKLSIDAASVIKNSDQFQVVSHSFDSVVKAIAEGQPAMNNWWFF